MRIAILYASAGHGHQKAAEAAREGLVACGVPENEILVYDSLNGTFPWFKKFYTSLYFNSVKHTPKLWGASYQFSEHPWFYRTVIKHVRASLNGWVGRKLVQTILDARPETIICTHFFAPELLGRLKLKKEINYFLVAVITDFIPHGFWVNPGTDHYWVMSDEGKGNLEKRGITPDCITAGGIPISLCFRPKGNKREVRRKLELDPNRFTILITSGSFGLGPTAEALDCLGDFKEKVQAIVICGKNETQYSLLKAKTYPFPVKLYGFVSNMDELMEASDLLIAKPGGATTSESLAKGIPMVVLQPIPGQEMGNSNLLKQRNVSFFLGQTSDLRTILKAIFDHPKILDEKRREIERLARPNAAIDLAKFVLSKIDARR